MRRDVKSCGCAGTNPFPTNTSLKVPAVKAVKVEKPVISQENLVDLELQKLQAKRDNKDSQIQILQNRVIILERENLIFNDLKNREPRVIDILPTQKTGQSESGCVFVWSDWHHEELVRPEQVSGQNDFNLEEFKVRFWNLLKGNIAWFKINAQKTAIKNLVIAILGDMITGSIHEDLAEGNQLAPADAIYSAFSYLVTAIQYVLDNTGKDVKLQIVCHSGNHGRMTKEQRIATEAGNSLEYFMYLMLRDAFQKEKRIEFTIQAGYHSYVRFFEGAYVNRFHHGHQINYQGGVGGITIPVNKSIAQWNKARPADLDTFGHFHTRFDGGNFIANGSIIGYNAYAVSIKASFEQPAQQMYLINREYAAKTAVMPVFVKHPIF